MKKIFSLISAVLAVAAFTGCAQLQKTITPKILEAGVSASVGYAAAKYPTAVPYLRAVAPIVCSAADGTNLAPSQVIAAIETSSAANLLKTPEAVLIANAALDLYAAVWDSYGADAVNSVPTLKLYLQATCNGMNEGLPSAIHRVPATTKSGQLLFPKISFP